MKKIYETKKAPKAIGPYSQAVAAGGLLFLSGQIPLDPTTMKVKEGSVADQAEQVLENIGAILQEAGIGFEDVVKTTVLLTDMRDFKKVNEVYARYFGKNRPARAAYQVAALPMGVSIEIESIAVLKS